MVSPGLGLRIYDIGYFVYLIGTGYGVYTAATDDGGHPGKFPTITSSTISGIAGLIISFKHGRSVTKKKIFYS